MADKRISLRWPVLGLDKRGSYRRQRPYSTPDADNVWPDDTLEERERGGSRAGLVKAYSDQLAAAEVFLLPTGRWSETSNSVVRETAAAICNGTLYVTASDGSDTSASVSGCSFIPGVPLSGAWHRSKLYIADYNTVPAAQGTDGVSSGTSFDSATYADWTAITDPDDSNPLAINDHILEILSVGSGGAAIGRYKIDTIASGNLTLETAPGDATGITWRIRRGAKVWDPNSGLSLLADGGFTTVPNGQRMVVEWQDRLVWAGDPLDANNWHASKIGVPTNYTVIDEATSAISGDSDNSAGQPGEPITALIPHSNVCLLFGGSRGLYVVRGNPSGGGGILKLSHAIGAVDQHSWTYDANDYLFLLTPDGLYFMPPGCGDPPFSLSRELLPEELRDTDLSDTVVAMGFDLTHRKIHLSLTDTTSGATAYSIDIARQGADHSPPRSAAFWPVSFAAGHQFFSAAKMPYASDAIFGCRDGYIRKFSKTQETDDGTAFNSYCVFGPLQLGRDGQNGSLDVVEVTTDTSSGDVDVDVQVGNSFQAAVNASAGATLQNNTAGRNNVHRPELGGYAACLKVKNGEVGNQWALEELLCDITLLGERRL